MSTTSSVKIVQTLLVQRVLGRQSCFGTVTEVDDRLQYRFHDLFFFSCTLTVFFLNEDQILAATVSRHRSTNQNCLCPYEYIGVRYSLLSLMTSNYWNLEA